MPVIFGTFAPTTTTVQQVIDGTSQDIRQVLDSSVPAQASILTNFCDRISLQMLRASNWQFLLSEPQQFITQLNVTDYWIGSAGENALGQADTGLGLTDLRSIRWDSVFDRSNNVRLAATTFKPNGWGLANSDGSARPGRPKQFLSNYSDRYVLSIYPGPDNQNTFRPTPEAPICTAIVNAGSQPARFYWVRVTFVDDFANESDTSAEARVFIPANMVMTVFPPQEPVISATGIRYTQYNIYISTTSGNETKQNASPIATNTSWQEPNSGLIAGATFPTNNNLEPIDGYLIEFQYYKLRESLTSTTQVIQIPDDYYDLVVCGVNWLASQYLKRPGDAKLWMDTYRSGFQEMIRDKNQFPKGADFIHVDPASVVDSFTSINLGIDPSVTRTS